MGCRRYFVANRLEVLVDEDDSRSSSRVREHGSLLFVSQLHVAIQTLWSQCLFPRAVWILIWSASTFSSASLSWSKRSTDTGTQLLTSLPVLTLVLSQSNKTRLSISCALEPDCSAKTSLPVLTIGFLVGIVGSLYHLQQLLNPIISSNFLERKSSEEVEVTHILSRVWFLQFPSW